MFEETDCPDNLPIFYDSQFSAIRSLAGAEVTGITNDLLRLDGLVPAPNTNEVAVTVCDNFVDLFIKHIGAAVNGRETGEGLGEFSKTIEWIDIWRFAVTSH